MFTWLRSLFVPELAAVPAEELRALQGRVRALEAERLELVTEWVKTRDQVLRYMKRAGQLRAHEEARLPDMDEESDPELDRMVLRAKFRG